MWTQMNPYIKNPRILLLKCPIEYLYREETKFTCIEPIVLQVRRGHFGNLTEEESRPASLTLRCFLCPFVRNVSS